MKAFLHLIVIAFIFVFTSCDKKDGHIEADKNNTGILFQLAGVSDYDKEELLASTKGDVNTAQNISMEEVAVDNNISLFVSSETNAITSSNKNNKIAATSLMGENIRYRVLIYEKDGSNWKFFKHHDVTSGSNNPANNTVALPLNKEYKWVAYSYGETTDITDTPPATGTSSTIPYNIQTRHNSPTLYCPGNTFTNNASTMTQTVLFTHKTSKIEVLVDTRGLFADNGAFVKNITSLSADILAQNKITTTALNLFTGTLDANHQVAAGFNVDKPITINTNLVDIDGFRKPQTYSSAKSSSDAIYTSLAPNAANFSVKIKELSVLRSKGFTSDADVDTTATGNIADGTTGSLINSLDDQKTASFSSTTTSNTVGKLLKLNIRFGDSGVLLKNRYWAKGNLYFKTTGSGANVRGEYRIDRVRKRSTAFRTAATAHRHYYWRYNMLYPYSMTQTVADEAYPGDACARLHPLGVWRTPTKADFRDQLVNSSSAVLTPNNSTPLTFQRYFDGVSNPTVPAANNHLVIRIGTGVESATNKYLYMTGSGFYVSNTGVLRGPAEASAQGIEMNTLNNPGLGNWGFKVLFSSGSVGQRRYTLIGPENTNTIPNTYQMNDGYWNAFGKDSGHALRCVRNL